MANLGKYQVGDELYRTAFGSVCSAKLLDASGSTDRAKDFVVKIFDPPNSGTDDFDPAQPSAYSARAAAFVEGVRAQQQVATSGTHWAPIHDAGNGDNKPYYVTNYYARTTQKLLSGRVNLSPAGLHEIMQAIVLGLIELKNTSGRAHGNLKPTNVLISGQALVSAGKIVLTDPAAGPCNDDEAGARDLRAVGALLYQLVLHKPAVATTLSVPESEEWTRLGRRGRDWRQLCGNLLSIDPAERKTLADLELSVRRLVPVKIPIGKIAAAVVGCATIVGTAGWGASKWEQSVRAEVKEAQTQWFSVLQDPSLSDVFAADPLLRDRLIEDNSYKDVIKIALSADEGKAFNSADMRQVLHARSIYRNSHRKWIEAFKKDLSDLSDKVKLYKSRGWNIPDRYAQLPTVDDDLPASEIAKAAQQLRDLRLRILGNGPNAAWAALDRKLDLLKGTHNNYLEKFANVLRDNAGTVVAPSDTNWVATSAFLDSDALATKLLDKARLDFDLNRFTAEEKGMNLDKPSLADVQLWLKNVDLYVRVPDAGRKAAEDCKNEFAEQIGRGLKENPDQWPRAGTKEFEEFSARRSEIEQKFAALESSSFLRKDLRLGEKDPGSISERTKSIKDQIAGLRSKYFEAPDDPAKFVASLPKVAFKDATLKSMLDRDKADLAGKTPGALTKFQFGERKLQIQSLQKVLKSLDEFAPAPELSGRYKEIAQARRQQDFKRQWDQVGDGSSLASAALDNLAVETTRSSDAYAQWSNRVKDLARDFGEPPKANQILELPRLPDQNWRSSSEPQVSTFWQKEVQAPGTPLNMFLGAYLSRLDNLRTIQEGNVNAVTTVLTTKTDPPVAAEILVAAWRRIAGEGILASPARIETLNQESLVRVNLAAVKSAIDGKQYLASDSLVNDLQQELARGPQRWCAAVNAVKSAADVRAALSLTQPFGIDDKKIALAANTKDLGPAAYYNIALGWAQDAIAAKNAGVIPSRLDALAKAADVLPSPGKADFGPLVRWLNASRAAYGDSLQVQLEALLKDSLFYFPAGKSLNVFDQVFAAGAGLRDKQPQQGIALLKGFLPDGPAPLRAQFAKPFFDLGSAAGLDPASQLDAYAMSMRLGNKDAIAAMVKIADKAGVAKELKNLADADKADATVQGEARLQLAIMYESGLGVPKSLADARKYYILADKLLNLAAHDWLTKNPTYADEARAQTTLLAYQDHVKSLNWDAVAADIKDLGGMQSVAPATKLNIDGAIASFKAVEDEPAARKILSLFRDELQGSKWELAATDLAKLTAMLHLTPQSKNDIASAIADYKAVEDEPEAQKTLALYRGDLQASKWDLAAANLAKLTAMLHLTAQSKSDIAKATADYKTVEDEPEAQKILASYRGDFQASKWDLAAGDLAKLTGMLRLTAASKKEIASAIADFKTVEDEPEAKKILLQYQADIKANKGDLAAADINKLNGLNHLTKASKNQISGVNVSFKSYKDQAEVSKTLLVFEAHMTAGKFADARTDLEKISGVQDLPPPLKQKIASAQDRLKTATAVVVRTEPPKVKVQATVEVAPPPPVDPFPDEAVARNTLSLFDTHVREKRWVSAAADIKALNAMRAISPQLRQDIAKAEVRLRSVMHDKANTQ